MTDPSATPVHLQVALDPREAYALAELCKRIGWSDCRALAVDDLEAYRMIDATNLLRQALQDAGVIVR